MSWTYQPPADTVLKKTCIRRLYHAKSCFRSVCKKKPVTVMARGMMERVLNPEQLDEWFARLQTNNIPGICCSQRFLTSRVRLSVAVIVLFMQPIKLIKRISAFQSHRFTTSLMVSNRTHLQSLVRYAAQQVEPVIKKLGGTVRPPLPGLRIRLLDGNCIEKTEHRIKELRSIGAGPLLENPWWFMILFCVCLLKYFHVKMAMLKSALY